MDLFYLPALEGHHQEICFCELESKHLTKVLRKQLGDLVKATNGRGLEMEIELTQLANRKTIGHNKGIKQHSPLPYSLHIAIAPTKNIGRLEWFLEKATEIGIHQITPLLCDHSERKIIKKERLEKIIVAALKQSQQCYLPHLNDLTPFQDFVINQPGGWIAHCHQEEKPFFFSVAKTTGAQTVLIGPEGDFSLSEVALAKENNFQSISFGNQRLRTETAGLVACQTIAIKAQ